MQRYNSFDNLQIFSSKLYEEVVEDSHRADVNPGFGVALKIAKESFTHSRAGGSVHGDKESFGRRAAEKEPDKAKLFANEGCKVEFGGPEAQDVGQFQQKYHGIIAEVAFYGIKGDDGALAPVKKTFVTAAFSDCSEEDLAHEHRYCCFGERGADSGEEMLAGEFPGPPEVGFAVGSHFAVEDRHRAKEPGCRLMAHRHKETPPSPEVAERMDYKG